jgi:hypothetical protein
VSIINRALRPTTKSAATATHLRTNHFTTDDDFNAPIPLPSFGGAFRRSEASMARQYALFCFKENTNVLVVCAMQGCAASLEPGAQKSVC